MMSSSSVALNDSQVSLSTDKDEPLNPVLKRWLIVASLFISSSMIGTMPTTHTSSPFILLVSAAGSNYDITDPGGPKDKGIRKPSLIMLKVNKLKKKKKKKKDGDKNQLAA